MHATYCPCYCLTATASSNQLHTHPHTTPHPCRHCRWAQCRMAPAAPYTLPDGRTLAQALAETAELQLGRGHWKTRSGNPPTNQKSLSPHAEQHPGWNTASFVPKLRGPLSELEVAELTALARVGAGKRRRWLNEKVGHGKHAWMNVASHQARVLLRNC